MHMELLELCVERKEHSTYWSAISGWRQHWSLCCPAEMILQRHTVISTSVASNSPISASLQYRHLKHRQNLLNSMISQS